MLDRGTYLSDDSYPALFSSMDVGLQRKLPVASALVLCIGIGDVNISLQMFAFSRNFRANHFAGSASSVQDTYEDSDSS